MVFYTSLTRIGNSNFDAITTRVFSLVIEQNGPISPMVFFVCTAILLSIIVFLFYAYLKTISVHSVHRFCLMLCLCIAAAILVDHYIQLTTAIAAYSNFRSYYDSAIQDVIFQND